MAYQVPDAYGKVSTTAEESGTTTKHTEVYGYTDINVFDSSQASLVSDLQSFARSMVGLTNNWFKESRVEYSVDLDNIITQ